MIDLVGIDDLDVEHSTDAVTGNLTFNIKNSLTDALYLSLKIEEPKFRAMIEALANVSREITPDIDNTIINGAVRYTRTFTQYKKQSKTGSIKLRV